MGGCASARKSHLQVLQCSPDIRDDVEGLRGLPPKPVHGLDGERGVDPRSTNQLDGARFYVEYSAELPVGAPDRLETPHQPKLAGRPVEGEIQVSAQPPHPFLASTPGSGSKSPVPG